MVKIISWNVNGLRAAFNKGFRDRVLEMDADIYCLQEIKAQEDQLAAEMKAFGEYEGFFFPAERKGYSGTAIYTRLPFKTIRRGMGIEKFDIEGRDILLDFGDFLLFNSYFPNGGQGPERLAYKMEYYETVLDWAKAEQKPLLICGDVNTAHKEIDLANPKSNEKNTGFLPCERDWIDRLLAAGFHDTFRMFNQEPQQYSWWDMKTRARDRNVGWRIDYFFANEAMKPFVKDAWIWQHIMGSDHCPIGVEIEIK